jgi:hypothetical protein
LDPSKTITPFLSNNALATNLMTAKALSLDVPRQLQRLTDEVIE